jgi:hypothetical protein
MDAKQERTPRERGYHTGRKARLALKHEPLHIDIHGNPRSAEWIAGMQKGYYGTGLSDPTRKPRSVETPAQDDKIEVKCKIDKALRDKAVAMNVRRSAALELGLRLLTGDISPSLMDAFAPLIQSVIVEQEHFVIVDKKGNHYSGKTELEALLAMSCFLRGI